MSWYEDIAAYINHNLETFIEHFFPDAKPSPYSTGIRLNPCPKCGHNDCFSFSKTRNSGNCFSASCGLRGTRIQILEEVLGQDKARRELEKWSGIRYIPKEYNEEERQAYELQKRVQEIADKAVQFYHERLMSNPEAMEKQMGTDQAAGQRGHTAEALKTFRVGLSGDYLGLFTKLKNAGYTQEELKEANRLVWVPDGYFIYPYYDVKGSLVRINTKMFYRSCQKKQDVKADGKTEWVKGSCQFVTYDLSKAAKEAHEKETGHKMALDGYSTGEKTISFYYPPAGLQGKRKAILVEGENDVISTWEEIQRMPKAYQKDYVPVGIGGKMEESAFRELFLRQFDAIYECFDQDDAGDAYRFELNEKLPDVPVYKIKQDADFKDIDQFLKSVANQGEFKEWLDEAQFVDTAKFLIDRDGYAHNWILKNRKFRLEFHIDSLHQGSGQLEGTLLIYKGGQLADKRLGRIDSMKVDNAITYAKLALSQHLDEYYNDITWSRDQPKRSFWELRDILFHTKEYFKVIKQLAWYLFKTDKADYEKKIKYLQDRLNQKVVAEVLKEVNGYENDVINPNMLFPRIQLSQYFHVTNDDAFFYFSKLVKEGDVAKLVPCLLNNKKEEIRLDLLKRKDPQCLLLINNRYELPMEVPTAVMDPVEVSLQPYWVERWRNDELDPSDYDPSVLIGEIENFIRKCYYTTAEIAKVLALWIYSTYFYMLFKSGFPYLIFNGPKGSGKSTFDTIIYLLALNPKFALDMSESSLFRTISVEGGTFILDEIEDLVDKRTVNSSGYAKVLKGGYADLAYVYRMNMDKGVSERFSVFGPKVISNINGIEDVIGDRCIYVRTVQAPESELRKLESTQDYKEERRSEVHTITSRCAISALVHFKKVNELFNSAESRLNTGNARLTQILRPLLAMASFVGGDYAENLMNYYDREIRVVKEEISSATTEGMLTNILKRIAEEHTGLEKEKWATNAERHLYTAPITYHAQQGLFEVDTLHLKILCEEINSGQVMEIKEINAAMRNVLGSKFDLANHRKQTSATIIDEALQRQFDGKRHIRVYRYFLNVENFVDKGRIIQPLKTEGSLF